MHRSGSARSTRGEGRQELSVGTTAVEQAWHEIDSLVPQITDARASLSSLYDRRRAAFQSLLDGGVPQAEIARRAGVTPMAVDYAVNGRRKRRDE